MPERRRKFSPRYKAEAVRMVVQSGRTIAEVVHDLETNSTTLENRVNNRKAEHPEATQEESPLGRPRLSDLEVDVARLRMENEFLKKRDGFKW